MIQYTGYQSLAGPVVRVCFNPTELRRIARRHLDPRTMADVRKWQVEAMACIIDWDISDAKPTARTVRKLLPIDVVEGLVEAMTDCTIRERPNPWPRHWLN